MTTFMTTILKTRRQIETIRDIVRITILIVRRKMEIRVIEVRDYKIANDFQCEYLDDDTSTEFTQRVESNLDLYFVAIDGGDVVGVCYGNPLEKDDSTVLLQGIAVNLIGDFLFIIRFYFFITCRY
jgi:hypothetical protein